MFYDKVRESVNYIEKHIERRPKVGLILGSGLGALVDIMQDKQSFSYKEIPHFPQSRVEGHAGNLVFGEISNLDLVVMQGRFHYYEGFTMGEVTYPLYVMKMLGVESLIVTNACGGINREFSPGDLMLIDDFINPSGDNPLIGENDSRFGPRFPDMSEPYTKILIEKAEKIADQMHIIYQHGVYALYTGPSYETASEIRAYERMGADAVGMSTVPETIVANYLGMQVLGIACITNMATGIRKEKHSHEEVVKVANTASKRLCQWIEGLLNNW